MAKPRSVLLLIAVHCMVAATTYPLPTKEGPTWEFRRTNAYNGTMDFEDAWLQWTTMRPYNRVQILLPFAELAIGIMQFLVMAIIACRIGGYTRMVKNMSKRALRTAASPTSSSAAVSAPEPTARV